jgi:hypothetical protein
MAPECIACERPRDGAGAAVVAGGVLRADRAPWLAVSSARGSLVTFSTSSNAAVRGVAGEGVRAPESERLEEFRALLIRSWRRQLQEAAAAAEEKAS